MRLVCPKPAIPAEPKQGHILHDNPNGFITNLFTEQSYNFTGFQAIYEKPFQAANITATLIYKPL